MLLCVISTRATRSKRRGEISFSIVKRDFSPAPELVRDRNDNGNCMQNFLQEINQAMQNNNSLLCVGLDSDFARLPERFKKEKQPQFEFNKWIIEQTHEHVCCYKPNSAFYEARGAQGIEELRLTIDYLRDNHPEIPILLDAKRGDIGNTNAQYAQFAFKYLGVDAITLHPYQGLEALEPFLQYKDKGCIILCRTSNPEAREFQDRLINGKPLWQVVAERASELQEKYANLLLVVGATYPEEMKKIRKITGEMTFLVPGLGNQGGDLEAVIKSGLNSKKQGLILNSSRGIIFAENPGKQARELKERIKNYVNRN